MNRDYLTIPVLLAVGFAYGALRNRARVTKRMPVWVMAILFLGIFFVGLLLAVVTGSTTLGWLSGLSLMVLFPVAMLLGIGFVTGSLFNRSKSVAPSPPIGHEVPAALRSAQPAASIASVMSVIVDRDSVAAGDDTDSHAVTASVPVASNLAELVTSAVHVCPLPSISGDRATWLIDVGGTCVGVIAQQWSRPKFVVSEHLSVTQLFTGSSSKVQFRYWNQADPDVVFAALRDGRPLPPRY